MGMRIALVAAAAAVVSQLAACGGTSIHHRPRAHQPVGTPLPVEVSVRGESPSSGTVHYRVPGASSYKSLTLEPRSSQMWAMLPTESIPADRAVEYYIDVQTEKRMLGLGSPASPFSTVFLDPRGLIIAGLRTGANSGDSETPVEFVLFSANGPIDEPTAEYWMPGVPGEVYTTMTDLGGGRYAFTIPASAVNAGTWRYAISVPVDGKPHRIPADGFTSFEVAQAAVEAAAPPSETVVIHEHHHHTTRARGSGSSAKSGGAAAAGTAQNSTAQTGSTQTGTTPTDKTKTTQASGARPSVPPGIEKHYVAFLDASESLVLAVREVSDAKSARKAKPSIDKALREVKKYYAKVDGLKPEWNAALAERHAERTESIAQRLHRHYRRLESVSGTEAARDAIASAPPVTSVITVTSADED